MQLIFPEPHVSVLLYEKLMAMGCTFAHHQEQILPN
jgi:hypothetical protein